MTGDKQLDKLINNMQEKIELQNSIIEMQKDEIAIYRKVLEEIGAKLEINNGEAIKELGMGYMHEVIPIKTTHIYLDKKFAVNEGLRIKLELIDKMLKNSRLLFLLERK